MTSVPALRSDSDVALSDGTRTRIREGVAANTRRAYSGAVERFAAWCDEHGRTALPATGETLAEYVSHLADLGRSKATAQQAMAAIRKAHQAAGAELPDTERANLVMRAANRERSARGQRAEQAPPITRKALRAMVDAIDTTTVRGQRDHALLVLGFAMFARRSELAGLHIGDVTETDHGLEVWIRSAKTDHTGEGQVADVLRGAHPGTDPVAALRRWINTLAELGITEGPLLRTVDRHGNVGTSAMSGEAVSEAVRRLAVAADIPRAADYSGHSLRSGAATASFEAGAPLAAVCRAGRWADGSQAVGRYFRSVDRWRDHPMRDVM